MISLLGGWRRFSGAGIAAVILVYFYGLLVGVVSLSWYLFGETLMPKLVWWQYLLMPFAIGLVAIAIELTGLFLLNGFALEPGRQPTWRKWLGLSLLIFTLILGLLVPTFLNPA